MRSPVLTPKVGRLMCLRLQPKDAHVLEQLATGLSQLGLCRQMSSTLSGQALLWLRLGPDEWWCWQPLDVADPVRPGQPAVDGAIVQALTGVHHAWLELSDGQQALELAAPAWPVLSMGCDLDARALPVDGATRTRLSSFTVVLAAGVGAEVLLWVESSVSESLMKWLERAAAFDCRPHRRERASPTFTQTR